MEQVVSDEKMREVLGGDAFDELCQPPNIEYPSDHALWPKVRDAIREIYDPEIPVNIYELGLIYKVEINTKEDGISDIDVKMTLTSPGCPVAQEMPGWVQNAIWQLDGIGNVDVEIIWEPTWDPSMMAETAKMQLNMFA